MPELPDVEVQRRYLESTALHQPVAEVHVDRQRILAGTSPQQLGAVLHGRSFLEGHRHGKHLLVEIEGGPMLHLHFGMTGFLRYRRMDGEVPEHVRAWIVFENGNALYYDNQRLLGEVSLVDTIDRLLRERDLGPDALAVDRDTFVARIAARRGMIKSTLMDQSTLAGIGNVYSDEILFQARVHPKAATEDFDDTSLHDLWSTCVEVLETAIEAQTDPEAMPESYLLPQRSAGAACPRCGGEIAEIDVSGRSGYWCPGCQTGP